MVDSILTETEVIDTSEQEDADISNSTYQITSYGIDFTVDGLVNRLQRGDIYVPEFQRKYVWTTAQASKFVESLLLGLPVPGIFLSKDGERRLIVIDGHQRLMTLKNFYTESFALKGVAKQFEGRTYATLADFSRRTLDDSILHATVVQQMEPENDDSSIYHIFERLNSGGTRLQPQEIRSGLYFGKFKDLIIELNDYPIWRELYGKPSIRAKDQELVLRFFALYFDRYTYSQPLDEFLNRFMMKHRNPDGQTLQRFRELFTRTIDFIYGCLHWEAFRPEGQLNAAVYDAVMIGIATALEEHGHDELDCDDIQQQHHALLQKNDFKSAFKASTTDADKVASRIDLAIAAFS
ncbi:MAG: DUF262 domain-containing protein [Chloroflexota bacterium]|mgnify:CR=1 FL=1|nr:DUF262 domain-containing protein [Chloroflexota bacterium]